MPLPSSDKRKDTLHFGDSSFTVWCMILEKLKRTKDRDGLVGEQERCGTRLKMLRQPKGRREVRGVGLL